MTELQDPLPPGWESKIDKSTGKIYYINHIFKATSWSDPRIVSRQHQDMNSFNFPSMHVEHIPLQHGSPDLRRNYIYPTQSSPIPAFQMPTHNSPKTVPFQEMRSIPRGSPLSVRAAKIQDSSLTTASDTEETVNKIRVMFPTVSDTHIRLLLKKYHGREVVVISALQVEKHPITTPGPFATPPPVRNAHYPSIHATIQMTPPLSFRTCSRAGTPKPGSANSSNYTGSPCIGESYRHSPRPHSSPKLKLRYMKSLFPQPDETVILDVLASNDNNIQKTTEALKEMGFERKDTVKIAAQKQAKDKEEKEEKLKVEVVQKPPTPVPKLKTTAEKAVIKAELQQKYKDTPDHLITIALESVHYDEHRANQILQIMVQEEQQQKTEAAAEPEPEKQPEEVVQVDSATKSVTVSQSRQSLKSLLKAEKGDVNNFSRVLEEGNENMEYKSPYLSNTKGSDHTLIKGPNDKLLLLDYVDWQGPKPQFCKGPTPGLAKGPNAALRLNRTYQSRGPNSELRKGPKLGLAKGSIFAQLKDVVVGESRGK